MRVKNLIVFIVVLLITSFTANLLSAQREQSGNDAGKKTTVRQLKVGQTNASPETPKPCTGEKPEDKWVGLIIPKGETERAKKIRKKALSYQQQIRNKITKSLDTWIKANPNASAEEIEERRRSGEERIKFKINKINADNKVRINMKSWDWRTLLDVGPVLDQGEGCNTCWAFTTTSAAYSSLQKNYEESVPLFNYVFPDKTTGKLADNFGLPSVTNTSVVPVFVQDLLNCMPIKKEAICSMGWHGNAFDFMVYQKGIPVSYTNDVNTDYIHEYKRGQKYACSTNGGFIKGSSWDYVNSPPDKLPTVKLLKTALIEHGPLVAPIVFDKCLADYKGGVFSEKNMKQINHAVLLIGWDDEKGAWLVKNSWGEKWGEKGFAWIRYGSNNIGVYAAWIDASP